MPGASQAPVEPQRPRIEAKSAILVDMVSGQVMWEKDADVVRPPASTTKIMTAIMLLEHTRPTDVLRASTAASESEGSSLYLRPGEQISARDMLYGLMLRSANDGCVVVAEHVAGTQARFADMMTAKAQEIGAVHTVFRNASGLNDPPNETTARDLATMARYAARFPDFNEATRVRVKTITRTVSKSDTLLKNHALPFLKNVPGADGVKTGYTRPAGKCFVGSATRGGWRLLAVVLNSPDSMHEAAAVLEFGFKTYERRTVAQAGQAFGVVRVRGGTADTVDAVVRTPAAVAVRRGSADEVEVRPRLGTLTAPVAADVGVGALDVWHGGKVVASFPLVAAGAVPRADPAARGKGVGKWLLGMAAGSVVILYGRTAAKAARRRGRRIA